MSWCSPPSFYATRSYVVTAATVHAPKTFWNSIITNSRCFVIVMCLKNMAEASQPNAVDALRDMLLADAFQTAVCYDR